MGRILPNGPMYVRDIGSSGKGMAGKGLRDVYVFLDNHQNPTTTAHPRVVGIWIFCRMRGQLIIRNVDPVRAGSFMCRDDREPCPDSTALKQSRRAQEASRRAPSSHLDGGSRGLCYTQFSA